MKVVKSIALVLIYFVSVALSDTVVEDDLVKLNTTQPIQPKAPEKRSTKYAKIKKAREAAERKLKELAAELESLKSDDVVPDKSASSSAPAPLPLRAPEPSKTPASLKTADVKLPSSEVVDMDGDFNMQRQNKAKYEIPANQDKAKYSVQSNTGTSNAKIPAQPTRRRTVTKKVTSKRKSKAQEDWDAAHHDVHEYDSSHWVEVDGEMTRLHTNSRATGAEDHLVYHGSEDEYAALNGSHGHKIPEHEITMEQRTMTKRRTNVTKRPRRKTTEGMNGGYAAPQPTFYGMWTGQNLNGGYKAPVPGVYGGNKFKQGL